MLLQDTAAGVLQELLLLPATFEPSYRAKQYNAAVAKAMQDKTVRVRAALCKFVHIACTQPVVCL